MDGRQPGARRRRLAAAFAACGLLAGCDVFLLQTAGELHDGGGGDAEDRGRREDARDDAEPDDSTVPETGCETDDDCDDDRCSNGVERCGEHGVCETGAPYVCPDDGIQCTRDSCDPVTDRCSSVGQNTWCPAGLHCVVGVGCQSDRPRACEDDGDCNDSIDCTVDRCMPGATRRTCANDAEDADGDGVGDAACNGEGRSGDCDDANPDVSPALRETCNDLLDNDCDRSTDYEDDECPLTANGTCDAAVRLLPEGTSLRGDSSELDSDGRGSTCGGVGPNAYFRLTLDQPSYVALQAHDAEFDTVLFVTADCGGAEAACNDDRVDDPAAGSRIVFRGLPAGAWIVVVGAKDGEAGEYYVDYEVGALPVSADCENPIDAGAGGTFLGFVSDATPDGGSCGGLLGKQDRFRVEIPVDSPVDLTADARGTPFAHAVHGRAGGCAFWDGPEDLGCAAGDEDSPALLDLGSRSGVVFLTLEYDAAVGADPDPGRGYRLEINP